MVQQSRMAKMGELISMIAHQWRQPLTTMSAISCDLQLKLALEAFDLEKLEDRQNLLNYFDTSLNKINTLIQNLNNTMDDFRNFYKLNKVFSNKTLQDVVTRAINIIKTSFIDQKTEMLYEYDSDNLINMYDNEIIQVILNIIKNAEDNFLEKNIQNPMISIKGSKNKLTISDNGGGIPESVLAKIFDPDFSTKDESIGTGLGLYLSKIIIEDHHNGRLLVENKDDGVSFTIVFGVIA